MSSILSDAARRATQYLDGLQERGVAPTAEAVRALDRFSRPLPDSGSSAENVVAELDEVGSPATVANSGGRYFGFVIGSGLPVSLAANWLAGSWNQNVAMEVMSPVGARLEHVALEWTRDLLGLPADVQGAFVTGDTLANFTALAAARYQVLKSLGYDVASQGMSGAPPITVVVGEEVHISVLRAITLLGLGRDKVVRTPVDRQGRMEAERLPKLSGPTIVCTQVGNVNTGSFDPVREISLRAHEAGAWVHVDGAFGLWARAAPRRRALADGVEAADSWALDCHKWLNVPYDSGIAFVRNGPALKAAMATGPAAYIQGGEAGEPFDVTPEMSRRGRGIDAWAALRFLGRSGVADLVERCCTYARRFADRLSGAGFRILNDVVLNQVLVSFGDDAATRRVVSEIQREGTCWCGGTVWHGTTAMRISVSSWATTEADVDRSADAMIRIARQ
jgi:glutamate/tyrosine decarboxylase-like PLP-dependent enzyme